MAITKERKTSLIKGFQLGKNDTGSSEVQIALLTERINQLTGHLKSNVKDRHSRVGLIKMVERRKRLLAYLSKTSSDKYKEVIKKLDIRK